MLYDSCEKNAKLLGVEYIVSDKVYRRLPENEKKYWHPHTYEVLAGGLISPSMEGEEEMRFMKFILNTWGKTWHTWPDPTTDVPLCRALIPRRAEMLIPCIIASWAFPSCQIAGPLEPTISTLS